MFFPLYFVFAQEEPQVFVNEIAWMGVSVKDVAASQYWRYEWLELYNTTNQTVSVSGWVLELWREKLDYTVELAGTIAPQDYFVIAASDKVSEVDFNYANLGGKFNNAGQRIVLKNNLGQIVEELDFSLGWSAGDNEEKFTMERSGAGTFGAGTVPAQEWQTSTVVGGTPGAINSKPVAIEEFLQTKKDTAVPSQDIINSTTVTAGVLAVGMSFLAVLARRRLVYPEQRQKS
jgi:hypothetical protein